MYDIITQHEQHCPSCAVGNIHMQALLKVALAMQVPEVDECVQAIVNIVPLQLLSYHLTLLRGHNVDQPRNLAKSVTVTEEG